MFAYRSLPSQFVLFALLAVISSRPVTALSDEVNVFCTNASGDSGLINNAIAKTKPGDEIVIHGPAMITKTIVLLGGRKYRGDSFNTILTQANGANLTAMLATDSYVNNYAWCDESIQISNLDLEGNKANNSAATVGIMQRSWGTSIEDVTIENMGGDGIRVTNLSANGTALTNSCVNSHFSSIEIQNCNGNGFRVLDTGNAITDSQLLDSWIGNCRQDAIDLDNAAGWFVERDHVWGVSCNAIYMQRLYCTSVSDNYIEDFGSGATPGTWYGIYASLQGGVGSVIDNNRINGASKEPRSASKYVYLGITGNYGVGSVGVAGNQIFGAGTTRGVGFQYALGKSTNIIVTSEGNSEMNVHTQRIVGPGVTVTSGD